MDCRRSRRPPAPLNSSSGRMSPTLHLRHAGLRPLSSSRGRSARANGHIQRHTGEFVLGSPLNALSIDPPFREFFSIDMDGDKVELLCQAAGTRPDVHVRQGDCNLILPKDIFPRVRYDQYRRGLCLLDPSRAAAELGGLTRRRSKSDDRPLPQLSDHGCKPECSLARTREGLARAGSADDCVPGR